MSRQRLKNGASELQAINRRRDIHRKTIPALAQAGPVSVWMVLFVTIPMLYIIYVSFMSRGVFGDVVYEFSLESYQTLLDSTYFKVIVKSLQVALFTTVACLLLGYPFAYYIARKPPEVASRPVSYTHLQLQHFSLTVFPSKRSKIPSVSTEQRGFCKNWVRLTYFVCRSNCQTCAGEYHGGSSPHLSLIHI